MEIHHLKALKDNYIWLLQQGSDVIVVDPGVAAVVEDYITANELNLVAILLTHGHMDHVGGVAQLLSKFNVPVYGACEAASITVAEGSVIDLFADVTTRVIDTCGHTFDGVSFVVQTVDEVEHLFCGDTLFAAGCGRVFTNDYELMFASLNKIKQLNPAIKIYPGHEYTLQKLEFAHVVDANNAAIEERVRTETDKFAKSGITLPTTLQLELQTNPFLRVDNQKLQECVAHVTHQEINSAFECFVKLREFKNEYK